MGQLTQSSYITLQYEVPAGVYCPVCCLCCPSGISWRTPWLSLCPGLSPHLHPSCYQASSQGDEVPVKTITYGIKETGCKNSFGFSVPCLAEGEARRKRAADEEAAEAAPAAAVLPYAGLPLAYGYGLGAYGYGLGAYGYGLPYTYAAPTVTVGEPKVTEVEVPQYVYKAVNEKVELAPLCHNGLGFAVPCA